MRHPHTEIPYRLSSHWALLVFIITVLLSSGCASTQTKPEAGLERARPEAASVPPTSPSERHEPTVQEEAPEAPMPPQPFDLGPFPVESYYGQPTEFEASQTENDYLSIAVSALQSTRKQTAVSDPLLSLAARELSRYRAERQASPPARLFRFALHWAGRGDIAPVFFQYAIHSDENDVQAFREALEDWFKSGDTAMDVLGIGVYEKPLDTDDHKINYITILGVRQAIHPEAIPRQTPLEHRFFLSGKVKDPTLNYTMFLNFLGEPVFQAPLNIRNGGFRTEVQIPAAKAVYNLEITGSRDNEHRVLLNVPIYLGIDAPRLFDPTPPKPSCDSPQQCESILHEIIRKARQTVAQSPLIMSAKLVDMGRAHAKDMLEYRYQSIFDREGRNAQQRLELMNVGSLQAGEIVGGGYDLEAIGVDFLNSPSLIAYLENKSLTHMGCGVIPKSGDQRTYYSVSCILATLIDPREGNALREALFFEINRMREAEGKHKFDYQRNLQALADEAIERLLANPQRAEGIQGDINIELEESGLIKTQATFGVFTIFDLRQLETNSSVRQLVSSRHANLTLGVIKKTTSKDERKGIFVYYIAYH